VSKRIWSKNTDLNKFLKSNDNIVHLFFFDEIYKVDYRDQFLFFNAGTFFFPENVGNFHNRPEPGIFYGERPNNIIRKIEKKKILRLCHHFYPPYFFSLLS
jgi:hypothetical protein